MAKEAIRTSAANTDSWFDNHWIVDSTPVECGRPRPTDRAPASPEPDEREALQAMLDVEEDLIAGKGFASKESENDLAMRGIGLLRPSFKRGRSARASLFPSRCGS